jgi:putative transposase
LRFAVCFISAVRGQSPPKYLSSDHDPLYRFHQWEANLRILEVTEIKSVPYVPLSHSFVERLIGTIRREYLDRILFWTTADLEAKLNNGDRTHAGLEGRLPEPSAGGTASPTGLDSYRWRRSRFVPNSDSRLILLIRHAQGVECVAKGES